MFNHEQESILCLTASLLAKKDVKRSHTHITPVATHHLRLKNKEKLTKITTKNKGDKFYIQQTFWPWKNQNFEKNSKQLFMCLFRTVLCQNFSPLSLFWKNYLEIFENWFFDLEKTCFNVFNRNNTVSKFQPSFLKKKNLEIFENWPFDLEKIGILKKTLFLYS